MQNRGEKLKNFSFLTFICRPSKKFALGRTASPASPRDASVLVKLNTKKRILFEWLLALGRTCIIDSAYYRFCHGPSRTSRGLFVALLLKPGTSLSSHLLKSSYQGRPIRCGLASVRPPRLCRHRGTKSYPFLALCLLLTAGSLFVIGLGRMYPQLYGVLFISRAIVSPSHHRLQSNMAPYQIRCRSPP
ncbi:hypothetical protein J3E68DRAFT_271152 [Trichoderma sp. SZMC 28012]